MHKHLIACPNCIKLYEDMQQKGQTSVIEN